ncbi:hypothetical protein BT63DRAFT_473508 [Microthyrium microscopicum]|uniref:Uncharacterized protein n=1 Tax=Microthyrium microscopicum TaxID=703497 RepID=A0A6A6U670_9PEZI|nr:hypothetical protein BT63DRAFT_473508 [Microthyrium microscopicum]
MDPKRVDSTSPVEPSFVVSNDASDGHTTEPVEHIHPIDTSSAPAPVTYSLPFRTRSIQQAPQPPLTFSLPIRTRSIQQRPRTPVDDSPVLPIRLASDRPINWNIPQGTVLPAPSQEKITEDNTRLDPPAPLAEIAAGLAGHDVTLAHTGPDNEQIEFLPCSFLEPSEPLSPRAPPFQEIAGEPAAPEQTPQELGLYQGPLTQHQQSKRSDHWNLKEQAKEHQRCLHLQPPQEDTVLHDPLRSQIQGTPMWPEGAGTGTPRVGRENPRRS